MKIINMKEVLKAAGLFCSIFILSTSIGYASTGSGAEEWKGQPDAKRISLGVMSGLGIIDSSAGLVVLGTASNRILDEGFIPDINDVVSIEAQVGPVLLSAGTALTYSFHLRWDFQKNPSLALYALGGLGGNVLYVGGMNRVEFYPRFGVGVLWNKLGWMNWRAELSHEWIAVGANFPL